MIPRKVNSYLQLIWIPCVFALTGVYNIARLLSNTIAENPFNQEYTEEFMPNFDIFVTVTFIIFFIYPYWRISNVKEGVKMLLLSVAVFFGVLFGSLAVAPMFDSMASTWTLGMTIGTMHVLAVIVGIRLKKLSEKWNQLFT